MLFEHLEDIRMNLQATSNDVNSILNILRKEN